MSILHFSAQPKRAIILEELWGDCRALYAGDQWTNGFETAWGPASDVLESLDNLDLRHGLPIVYRDFEQGIAQS